MGGIDLKKLGVKNKKGRRDLREEEKSVEAFNISIITFETLLTYNTNILSQSTKEDTFNPSPM